MLGFKKHPFSGETDVSLPSGSGLQLPSESTLLSFEAGFFPGSAVGKLEAYPDNRCTVRIFNSNL